MGMTGSLCCTAKMGTTLEINYNKKKKKIVSPSWSIMAAEKYRCVI